jgi:DNA topoisomerase-3
LSFAERISREKGVEITDEAKANSAAMSVWIDKNQSAKPGKGRKTGERSSKPPAAKAAKPTKRARKPKATTALADVTPPLVSEQRNSAANTPLQIPYGNKDVAQKLGARYTAGGWYAPPGVDLSVFKSKGWL